MVVAAAIGLAAAGCAHPSPVAAAVVVTTPAPRAPDGRLPAPAGEPVLTITGRIERTNVERTVRLDEDGLDSLGRVRVELYEPWVKQRMSFQGVWLADVLAATDVADAATGVHHFSRPLPAADVPRFLRASGGHVGQGGVEDGQPAVDLGVGGGQRWGDAEGPAHPR